MRETEVDGVQTLLLPGEGPLQAGLTFRVGRADEPLARAGITHLLEHLALFRLGLGDYHYNGASGLVVTHFHASGQPDDVVAFFDGVCAGLAEPPVDRLEIEKSILRTEEAGTDVSVDATLARCRYGPTGYGLLGYREIGVPAVTADELTDWSRAWFTRQNAVLWISADEVPAGLRLRLPDGTRRPVPAPSSRLPATPTYVIGHAGGTAYDAVVRRSTAAGLYAGVLERQLFRVLRQEGGFSYTAGADYQPRDGAFATLSAVADALPDHQDAVLCGMVDVLARMRYGHIEQADLDSVRNRAEESVRSATRNPARLPSAAFNALTGAPNHTDEELRVELAAITLDDLRAVAVEAAETGLLMAHRDANWTGFAGVPTRSDEAVTGMEFGSREEPDERLVIGPDGVSVTHGEDHVVTVRYASCVALLAYPDGGRHLIGPDGIAVAVEPTLYEITPGTVARIDADVPPAVVVPMPARPPDEIPRPAPPRPPVRRRWSSAKRLIVGVLGVATLLTAVCTGLFTRAATRLNDDVAGIDKVVIVLGVVVTLALCGLVALFWSRPEDD